MTELQTFLQIIFNLEYTKAKDDNGDWLIRLTDENTNLVTFRFSNDGKLLKFKISI